MLRHLSAKDLSLQIEVDSCGLGDWHVGSAPDRRMADAALARGICISGKARQIASDDFDQFDLILAADHEVLRHLYQFAHKTEQKAKIFLMTEFSSAYKGEEVPDPYFRSDGAFDLVLDMLEDSCAGVLEHLRKQSDN